MLLELHFPKHTFTLKFLLQSAESLFDVVIADADLHVVFTTFLSLSCTRCAGRGRISDGDRLVHRSGAQGDGQAEGKKGGIDHRE